LIIYLIISEYIPPLHSRYVSFVRISKSIAEYSKTRLVLISFLIFMGTVIFILPAQSVDSPGESPDLSIFYTIDDLYRIAESYGEDGRTEYIQARLTFDVIWPLVYTFFLASSISWSFIKGFGENSRWLYTNLLPIAGLLLDYLENVAVVIVMWNYPARTPVIDFAATVFTPLKWMSLGFSFLLLFVGVGKIVWNKIGVK